MSKNITASFREKVTLPVGYEDPATGEICKEAEVRPVTGGDELFIGMSPEYNRNPNDLVYKTILLSRTVTRLGPRTLVTIDDITRLHARDIRELEYAVYRITYGEEVGQELEGEGPSG
ncbi:MAG: hypothetical protein ABIO70_20965 [Pseudomonadota bacterium]